MAVTGAGERRRLKGTKLWEKKGN
ncbi:uncharacterized protein G2W53_006726 [Senna tora]|uniref:Uncharacterized protein n=1 Tax=Senna tora TaxID=362788 RepID=A0A835CDE7_9FABA|nr:uncharacterized protein G2W53_006726 [Senna tora]